MTGPSVPTPYVAGTISLAAGTPKGVLELIHQQLNPHCPGTSVEFRIQGDPSNITPVFVGIQSPDAGPVSCTNYGYALTPTGEARRYRASYPGTGTPQGVMQVFSEAAALLHVEVNE
jgi:hypothetical protein